MDGNELAARPGRFVGRRIGQLWCVVFCGTRKDGKDEKDRWRL